MTDDSLRARVGELFVRVAPIVGVLAFLGVWEALVHVFGISAGQLPGPSAVFRHLASDPGFYWANGWRTTVTAGASFLLALVVGFGGGVAMALLGFVDRAVQPLAVLVQVTPIIAYAPAVVLWLGFGVRPVIFLASIICVVPFLLNTATGLRSVDPSLLELAHSVNASPVEILVRLRLPSALPYLLVAARISIGLALIGTVLGEYFAHASMGLGHSIFTAIAFGLPLQLWGSTYVLAFIGAIATASISALERRFNRQA